MNQKYFIFCSTNSNIDNSKIISITNEVEKPTFFILPKNDTEFVLKIKDQNKILTLSQYDSVYDAIEEIEKLNFQLIKDYYTEKKFYKWLKENNIGFHLNMGIPDDSQIKEIQTKTNEEMVYILYPASGGVEYYRLGFVADDLVIRIETKWKYLLEVWSELPQLHRTLVKLIN